VAACSVLIKPRNEGQARKNTLTEWAIVVCLALSVILGPPRSTAVPVHAATQEGQDPHQGQPDHCTNDRNAPDAHKCDCHRSENACEMEDKKCKVYCHKDHCHCFHPGCDS
jgi:hypothetical protein